MVSAVNSLECGGQATSGFLLETLRAEGAIDNTSPAPVVTSPVEDTRVRPPSLIVVSGAPGTGKTRLAHAIAAAIGCPAVCRDEIKEGMVHAQGNQFAAAPGDELTKRTFPLFFSVIHVLLEGLVSVVAEAAFQDRAWRAGLEPLLPLAELRIIRCSVADELAHQRRIERSSERARRAHADAGPVVAPSAFEAILLPAPSLVVDTTDGYVPDFDRIVRFANG